MTRLQAHEPELTELLDALCEGALTRSSAARLEQLASDDLQVQMRYITYLFMDASLRWDNPADMPGPGNELMDSNALPAGQCPGHPRDETDAPAHPPLFGFLDNSIFGKIGLTQNMPFAILIAAVLVGAGILIGSQIFTSPSAQVATSPSTVEPKMNYVGRVTGLVDCRWADPRTAVGYGSVPLGAKYAIASGLMEITYQSGAKVILQGPATYEVDSTNGGYLAIGKLTGRLDKNSNPQSLVSNPFAIRTSAATVTDLGTEFGLQVGVEGQNNVHVFEGKVKFETQGTGPRHTGAAAFVMQQDSATTLAPTGVVTTVAGAAAKTIATTFTRRLVHDPNAVDLLDIVAGGDGSGWRREQGVDPVTGNDVSTFPSQWRPAKAQYQSVPQQPLIDGVFVPDGTDHAPVQLDSVGHTFNGFPKTTGGALGAVWARAANVTLDKPDQQAWLWIYTMGPGAEYMPRNWGLLALHPNAGITFDLEAIRKTHHAAKTVRFRATAGAPRNGRADLWVFVDGQLQFNREKLQKQDGSIAVDVPLTAANRFLTLVSTDAGNGIDNDWLVLGDPVVELEGVKVTK